MSKTKHGYSCPLQDDKVQALQNLVQLLCLRSEVAPK